MVVVTDGVLALTGHAPEAFLRGDVIYTDLIHPEDRSHVRKAIDSALDRHEAYHVNYRIHHRSGAVRWVFERGLAPLFGEGNDIGFLEGSIEDITEKVDAESRVRAGEAQLRKIIDLVPHMIFAKDEKGKYLLVNRAAAVAYGTTVEDLVGRSQATIHPVSEEAERMLAEDRKVLASDEPLAIQDAPFTLATGDTRSLHTTKIAFQDPVSMKPAVLGINVDVTEEKRAAGLLKEKDQMIRSAFDHAPSAIFTSKLDGTITGSNQTAGLLFGYSPAEFLTMKIADLADGEDRARAEEVLRRVREGEAEDYSQERRYLRKDGTTVFGRANGSVVRDAEGRPVMVIIQFEDRTRSRRAELEADQLREELAHIDRLETMGELATSIAHEMNQPLTAISTYAQACRLMVERGSIEEKGLADILDKISRSAKHGGEVIRHLQDFVRKRRSQREPLQVNEIVADVVALMEADARVHGLEIRVETDESRMPVMADRVQIQQVVLNLIRNGADATRARGSSERLLVVRTEAKSDDEIEIAVIDHGIGIPEGSDGQLFRPFVTTKDTGMGLGLSISRSIVEAHGGRLWFTRNDGPGTTFRFTIPAAVVAADART